MARHEEMFIVVRNGRAFISRYISEDDGSFSWESAANAEELETAALEAVATQGGNTDENGSYTCPPDLAAQAQWYQDMHQH